MFKLEVVTIKKKLCLSMSALCVTTLPRSLLKQIAALSELMDSMADISRMISFDSIKIKMNDKMKKKKIFRI